MATNFVSAIWLAQPGTPTHYSEKIAFDQPSLEKLAKTESEAHAKGQKVTATFVGRFEYCPRPVTFANGYSRWLGLRAHGFVPPSTRSRDGGEYDHGGAGSPATSALES
jgi:hypothetical protein